jgi:formylglycine-generating enzyme required for sulfatase activity
MMSRHAPWYLVVALLAVALVSCGTAPPARTPGAAPVDGATSGDAAPGDTGGAPDAGTADRPVLRRPPPRGDEPTLDPFRPRHSPDLDLLGNVPAPEIELVTVPAGEFRMGPGPLPSQSGYEPNPAHTVYLDAYEIGRYEVTNEQYLAFVQDTGYRYPITWTDGYPADRATHPVAGLTWIDAVLFAEWMSRKTGEPWHLPTEAQWEKAAAWDAQAGVARRFPWGDEEDLSRANVGFAGESDVIGGFDQPKGTTPVDAYSPQGDSPYGAAGMAGNIAEWTNSVVAFYPYDASDSRENRYTFERRLIRGSDYYSILAPMNDRPLPSDWWVHLWGLRLARSSALAEADRVFAERVDAYIASYNADLAAERERRGYTTEAFSGYNRGAALLELAAPYNLDFYEETITDFTLAIDGYAKEPDAMGGPLSFAYYNRALAHLKLNQLDAALADIQTAFELDPTDPDVYYLRSSVRARMGDVAGAESDRDVLSTRFPGYQTSWTTEIEIALAAGRYGEVISQVNQYFAELLWFPPRDSRLFLMRAEAHDALGRTPEALSDYYVFLLWDPGHPEAEVAEARLAEFGITVPPRVGE